MDSVIYALSYLLMAAAIYFAARYPKEGEKK